MSFLKWFIKDKRDKDKDEKKKKKGLKPIVETPVETEEQRRKKAFDEYLNKLIAEGKRHGLTDEGAKKRAWNIIEKKLLKQRMKGIPVVCSVCNRYGSNKETGGLVRNDDGTYRHQRCRP